MKSGTESKLKFKQLQRQLGLALWEARGLLDTLWYFTANNCPTGAIGKFTDDEIAVGLDWNRPERSPSELVETLLSVRWLDENARERLIVHDWSEHCEDTVHKALARRVEVFADGSLPNLSRFTKKDRAKLVEQYKLKFGNEAVKNGKIDASVLERFKTPGNAPAIPSLTIPNHTKPPPPCSKPDCNGNGGGGGDAWAVLERELRTLGLADSSAAVSQARTRGVKTDELRAIVAHWQRCRGTFDDDLKALHFRIRNAMTGDRPEAGWPKSKKVSAEKKAAPPYETIRSRVIRSCGAVAKQWEPEKVLSEAKERGLDA